MDNVSGERIRHELELLLKEGCPEKALQRSDNLGLLKQADISPVHMNKLPEQFALARERYSDSASPPLIYLAVLCWPMPATGIERIIDRLHFPKQTATILRDLPAIAGSAGELSIRGLQPSRIYELLKGKKTAALLAATLCLDAVASEHVEAYLDVLRYVKSTLAGGDMERLGVPAGPIRSEVLAALRNARLDGTVSSRAEEEDMVRHFLEETRSD